MREFKAHGHQLRGGVGVVVLVFHILILVSRVGWRYGVLPYPAQGRGFSQPVRLRVTNAN
jgi:hypothetical protein